MKLLIKESSIKSGEKNSRIFTLLSDELNKYVDGLAFDIALQQGNTAICESNEFDDTKLKINPDAFKKYVKETLNFRYENFTILFV
jgi:hypothetical protein